MTIASAQDYILQVQQDVHDTTGADFSSTTLLNMINQARTRVALDTHCYRQFITGLNTITQQERYLYNGSFGGVNVTNGGMNYSNPAISFVGGVGSGAVAEAEVTAGVITAINMTNWGSGYSTASPPTIVITDDTGVGAAATPVILFNVLDILSIAVQWGTLKITFGWLPFTAFQAYCRAYTQQYSTPGVFTMFQGILNNVFIYPIPDQVYPMEMDVITLPTDLALPTSAETQIIAPWNDAVQYFATFLALSNLQQLDKAKFWLDLYEKRVKQLCATSYSRRIPNPYRTYYPLVRKL